MQTEYLQNDLILLQAERLFPLGTDAMVLADFAQAPRGAAVCDLCAGGGAVGLLMMAADPTLRVTAVELQAPACALMEQTREKNGLAGRFTVLQGDIREIRALLPQGSFRHVVCNPPYDPAGSGAEPEDEAQAIARTERFCSFEDVCRAARWLLPTGGSLWLVHRPERLAELCCELRAAGLEPKRLRAVCPRPGSAPSLLLLRAVRGGKPGLDWQAPLTLADETGQPTEEYRRIYHMD